MGDPHADGFLLGRRGETNQALDISPARARNEFHLYLFLLAGFAGMAGPGSRCPYRKLQMPGPERGHPAKPAGVGRHVVPLLLVIQAQDILPDIGSWNPEISCPDAARSGLAPSRPNRM